MQNRECNVADDARSTVELTQADLHWFNEGTHSQLYKKLGAQPIHETDLSLVTSIATRFTVWAPHARTVSVIGDFNDWNPSAHHLQAEGHSGLWSGVVPSVDHGSLYKFHLESRIGGYEMDKADPFGFCFEVPPQTASRVWNLQFNWTDETWMRSRAERHQIDKPISIYHVDPGSWMRVPEENRRVLRYDEFANKLVDYVVRMNFTHVELTPLLEYPAGDSLGYEASGWFAPTSRYGSPDQLMHLINCLHEHYIGVILDWPCYRFASDRHALAAFDGTNLYERTLPHRKPDDFPPLPLAEGRGEGRVHSEGRGEGSPLLFDHSRPEIHSFHISSACFWLDKYHVDGLRLETSSSPFSSDGKGTTDSLSDDVQWQRFVSHLETVLHRDWSDCLLIGGKLRDEITTENTEYTERRTRNENIGIDGYAIPAAIMGSDSNADLRSAVSQASSLQCVMPSEAAANKTNESDTIPISPLIEVGARDMLWTRVQGDDWRRFARLRCAFTWLWTQCGKKSVFMGNEFGQRQPWNPSSSLDWHLFETGNGHAKLARWFAELNSFYRAEPILHQTDSDLNSFKWIEGPPSTGGTLSWIRNGTNANASLLIVINLGVEPRHNFRVGVPTAGTWKEILNSDATEYGGSAHGNLGAVQAAPFGWNARPYSLTLTLPPLGAIILKNSKSTSAT